MKHTILVANEQYDVRQYDKEEELKSVFGRYYCQIISLHSYWMPLEKRLKSRRFKNFRDSNGDGFLLVWDNPTTPTLYITEIELKKHPKDEHILPQIGNFISFIQSAQQDDLNRVRDFIYDQIKINRVIFDQIVKATKREVLELLEDAMDDIQILLVIDKITPELSIGLDQIEKAISVKIRKIEVSRFLSKKNEEVILFSDSEAPETEGEELKGQYTIDYHLKNKPEKIVNIVNKFYQYVKQKKGMGVSPMKQYIGFFKNNAMIFSCVVRKKSVVFYSKAEKGEIRLGKKLPIRDVRKIGHYTNHLPTEIVITEEAQMDNLKKYFDKVYNRF